MRLNFKGYFRAHYKISFNEKDILNYKKWFFSQWNFINSKLKIKPGNKILEIGSGFGGFYSFLKMKNTYIGLELDNEAVQFARNYFSTECFISESIEEFKEDKSFDLIFAFEVLEHLENPLPIIQKIHRLLKTNGVFCGTSPFPFHKNILADPTHLFVLHPKNWERLFLNSRFRKVELYPMSFFPLLWRLGSKLNLLIPIYIYIFSGFCFYNIDYC